MREKKALGKADFDDQSLRKPVKNTNPSTERKKLTKDVIANPKVLGIATIFRQQGFLSVFTVLFTIPFPPKVASTSQS